MSHRNNGNTGNKVMSDRDFNEGLAFDIYIHMVSTDDDVIRGNLAKWASCLGLNDIIENFIIRDTMADIDRRRVA